MFSFPLEWNKHKWNSEREMQKSDLDFSYLDKK